MMNIDDKSSNELLQGTVMSCVVRADDAANKVNMVSDDVAVSVVRAYKTDLCTTKSDVCTVIDTKRDLILYSGRVTDIREGTSFVSVKFHTRGRWGKDYQLMASKIEGGPFALRRAY